MGDVEKHPLLEEDTENVAPKEALPTLTAAAHKARLSRKAIFLRTLACIGLMGFAFRAVREVTEWRNLSPRHPRVAANPDSRGRLTIQEVERRFLEVPNAERAISTSKTYSSLPHLAGSPRDFETAELFLELLQAEFSIPRPDETPVYDAGSPESQKATRSIGTISEPVAWIDKYYPVLNVPLGRALDILDEDGTPVWMANVEEVGDPADPAGEHARTIGAWHGLSKDGDVSGKLVYANYGRKADFDELEKLGVDLTGKIAIVRYGGVFRGLKVKAAQEAGAIGCLIYSDPRDDGSVTVENGYLPYPHGPALNPNSVQRGSVQFLSHYPGDPSTPGYPAYPNATRLEGGNIPNIPSLPVSWNNAKRLLEEIWGDYGKHGEEWSWKLDGKSSKRDVRLLNHVKTDVIPIWNAVGVIPGHIKNEIVLIGNHRDAWVMGAADPSSGTVSLTEVIKGFGTLLRAGWKPLRTIVIASWDAEEYGLIGSTEWGEDFADWLQDHAVAYLNLDIGVSGSGLTFYGSPSLAHLIRGAAQDVPHPTDSNRTLWDARGEKGKYGGSIKEIGIDLVNASAFEEKSARNPYSIGVKPLGSGSDYTVFLQRLGIASIDGGFRSQRTDAVYHYHSVYDSHRYQELYADPGFHRHVAIAKYLGLLALRLTDSLILPINTTQYALELASYLSKVENLAESQGVASEVNWHKLRQAIVGLQHASGLLDEQRVTAEQNFNKQYRKLGSKCRLARIKKCAMRRWKKLRNWIKSVYGVKTEDEHVRYDSVQKKHIDLPDGHPGLRRRFDAEGERNEKRDFSKVRLGLAAGKPHLHERMANVDGFENEPRAAAEIEEARSEKPNHPKPRLGLAAGSPRIRERANKGPKHQARQDNGSAVKRRIPRCKERSRDARIMAAAFEEFPFVIGVDFKLPKKFLKARKVVASVNRRLRLFEQGFISEDGIKGREWYRHLGVAPGKWLGYGAVTFPALTEALDEKNVTLAIYETERLAKLINSLAATLIQH